MGWIKAFTQTIRATVTSDWETERYLHRWLQQREAYWEHWQQDSSLLHWLASAAQTEPSTTPQQPWIYCWKYMDQLQKIITPVIQPVATISTAPLLTGSLYISPRPDCQTLVLTNFSLSPPPKKTATGRWIFSAFASEMGRSIWNVV